MVIHSPQEQEKGDGDVDTDGNVETMHYIIYISMRKNNSKSDTVYHKKREIIL